MKKLLAIICVLIFMIPMTVFAQDMADTITDELTTDVPVTDEPTDEDTTEDIVKMLSIDSEALCEGMEKTYAEGYIPTISKNTLTLVLPLKGKTFDNAVDFSVDLGNSENSPFAIGNYAKHIESENQYVYVAKISLLSTRYNGVYPVTITAEYLDSSGMSQAQSFIVNVTINDGKNLPDPNAVPDKEIVSKSELIISSCTLSEEEIYGGQAFTVNLEIENVGEYTARDVKLCYSDSTGTLMPTETNNSIYFSKISNNVATSFEMMTSPTAMAGNYPFAILIEYSDSYGTTYTLQREILVQILGKENVGYDNLNIPQKLTAGESIDLPVSIYNKGNATLYNVTATLDCGGLFPSASAFLGDLPAKEQGVSSINVFVGTLSMESTSTEDYGNTSGTYTITYEDETGEIYTITEDISTTIEAPIIAEDDQEEPEDPAFQSWISILVTFAVISIIISVIVVSNVLRKLKISSLSKH